jgi:ribonuclease-3
MSKLRASVVCEATLAKLAVGLGIDVFLRLGVGEDQTGGRQKASLLADAFESVLGAVFVDGGFHAAESVLLPMLIPEINARVTGSDLSDFKSSLQELLSKRHLSATYKIIAAEGPDHEKVFTACVTTEDGLSACGKGRSKKEAEQRAAETILKQLGSV